MGPRADALHELVRRVWRRIWADEIPGRAASLSYYFLFAVFPALLFITALVGLLRTPDLMNALMEYVNTMLPGDAASLLSRTLGEAVAGASGRLLSVGALVAVWIASTGTLSIMMALDVAYKLPETRAWWRRRLTALALTLALAAFTLAALVLLVFGERIGEGIARRVGLGPLFTAAWAVLQWAVAGALALTGIALVYCLAPARRRPWRWVTPGSAFALTTWVVMSLGLRAYVHYFGAFNATYGSIGGVILLMLWLYGCGLALLVGAEIDSETEQVRRWRTHRTTSRPRNAAR
ncbi:MAG: YihY/virulence factor BrkB family protein [Candidatus Rokuibacteriota bacterium]